jgi:hypothetical protein
MWSEREREVSGKEMEKKRERKKQRKDLPML